MTSFLSKQKSSKFLFLVVACFAATAGAAYDAGWTRTDCSNYSYRGLNERYVYGSNKGWIDNNVWDSATVEGVDCASYVCRSLALPEYVPENQSAAYPYATSKLYQGVSNMVRINNIEDLQPWDLWVWRAEYGGPSPGHTGLFKEFSGTSIITREALSESVGVLERTRRKQDMIDWGCRFYRRANWAAGSTPTVTVPSAQTNTANTIQQASATLSGAVLSTGGATIDSRGFAWGTTSDCESGWVDGTTATTFSAVLTGLSPDSRYYFQAQAHNSKGWGSGQVRSFVTAAATSGGTGGSEIIIDNGSSGTSSTGTWAVSGGTGSYGTNSLWARDGATYTWRFTPPSTGTYDVYMWWTQYASRGTAVPVAISHAAGKASMTVNQRTNGGRWNLLGQYNFSSTGSVTLTAAGAYPTSNCADAVKFVKTTSTTPSIPSLPPPSPPTELTADFTATAISGEAPLTVQFTDLSGPADTIYAWRWDFDYDGRYDSSAKNPTYTFTQPGTYDVRLVVFNADGSDDLVVRNYITVGSGSGGEPSQSAPGDIIMDNGSSGTSSTGTWGVSGGTNAYGSNSLWARETAAYRWTFTPTQTGRYEVSLWWTDYYSRGTAIPVQIRHSSGTANTTVNQQTNGGRWNTLGTYSMTAGQAYYVGMNTAGDGSTACADAIRVRWISD